MKLIKLTILSLVLSISMPPRDAAAAVTCTHTSVPGELPVTVRCRTNTISSSYKYFWHPTGASSHYLWLDVNHTRDNRELECDSGYEGMDQATVTIRRTSDNSIVATESKMFSCQMKPAGGGGGDECGAGGEDEDECGDDGSPILLDLDRNQFHLSGGPVLFDIDADGQPETVTWVSPGTQDAFLFLDRNGNGVVDDGSELFGDATLLISGEQAEHGYEALAEFDLVENGGNQDGKIDDADSIFSDLEVWIDSNANGTHESFESQSLAEADVLTIGLNYRESRRTDRHGNQFRYIGRGLIEVNGKAKKMATTDVFFKILAQ